jgi:outer membrane autotransporter protein
VLTATAPEETLSQSVLAREISFAQFFNIDARLAELRGAAGGFSSAGLMLSGSGGSLPLGNLLAGEEDDAAGGLFGSPWGFFINGTISNGEQSGNAQRGQVGVDFESRGLTAGVDYRFSNALTAGVALGYADFDADISGDSSIDTQGVLLTGYASWYPTERLYLDGRLSVGQIDFEQSRRIRFTLDGQTTDLLARGSADADQFSLAGGLGYHYNFGAWNVTPNASVRYSDTSVDGFTERGAEPFNLRFDATDTDSLLIAAGVQVSRAISTSRGVLTPQLSLSFNHESQDEDLTVIARFADGGSQAFRLDNPATDSSYGALGLGMVYVGPNGVQAYVNYRTVFGYEDFDRDTINLGARFEF